MPHPPVLLEAEASRVDGQRRVARSGHRTRSAATGGFEQERLPRTVYGSLARNWPALKSAPLRCASADKAVGRDGRELRSRRESGHIEPVDEH